MSASPILNILSTKQHSEKSESEELRYKALAIVKDFVNSNLSIDLSDVLFELLDKIIKPLFSKSQHDKLTPTGRKKLIRTELPAAATRFSQNIFFDDDKPLWKNGWTSALLTYVIEEHHIGGDTARQRKIIEKHFHLLVPPILHMIDDVDVSYKAEGCEHLCQLSKVLMASQSTILKSTGLTDVFIEALRSNFSYLPSLTSEDDSFRLYKELYPAFLGLVQARFSPSGNAKDQRENSQKHSYLTLLLRHQLLSSLTHLSTGSGMGGTISPKLSTLFLENMSVLLHDMGEFAAVHLRTLVPLLSNIMSDPFSVAVPSMLLAAVTAFGSLIEVCVSEVPMWWADYLRPVVACWDIAGDEKHGRLKEEDSRAIQHIQTQLRIIVQHLRGAVGQDFVEAEQLLVLEEGDLRVLFSGGKLS